MDLFDLIIILLMLCMLFLLSLGIVMYFLNIQHQKNMMSEKLDELDRIVHEKNNSTTQQRYITNNNSSSSTQNIPINVSTRGIDEYRQIGILSSSDDDTRILPLFGRRTYNGSSKWNYYTYTDGFQKLELSVVHQNKDCKNEYGCDELYTDDKVIVPGYNNSFNVIMYKKTGPTYIPYIN